MVNPLDMTGRTMVVTGASSGIGRETAVLLSQLGCHVILVGRDRSRLEASQTMLEGTGHRVEPYDLSALDDIPIWLKRLANETGPLAGLVHCAGLQLTLPVRQVMAAQVGKLLDINLTAGLMLAKGFRQKHVHATPGSLVFVSSIMGLVGAVGRSIYCASKCALVGMTKSLALELAADGLRVNCVAPAFVETAMFQEMKNLMGAEQIALIESSHPLGIGQPRDVAHAIAFMLADTGRWITGTTLVVDGGYTAK